MGRYITTKDSDLELLDGWSNFAAVATNNQAALQLSASEVAEITNAVALFVSDYGSMVRARIAAQAATTQKDDTRSSTRAVINKWAKIFRANEAISDALLTELLLAPHQTPGSSTTPTQPLDLVANSNGEGWTQLKWNRNGNKPGTTFQIWQKSSATDLWVMVGSTTKTRWTTALVVGKYAAFQVIATRASMASIASTPIVLWHSGETFGSELAA